ncbi:MAG: response regulator [Desulfamplus sp.]|nr:response regulator [Desulfamplus sp.]
MTNIDNLLSEATLELEVQNQELQRAYESLQESEEKYRVLTETMKDVVWVLDTKTLRFLYVSPSVKRLRGFTPEEIIAVPLDEALTPDEREYVKELIRVRTADYFANKDKNLSEEFYTNEVEQPCKDGSIVSTEVITKYHLNEKTGVIELWGVTRDITERKQAEKKRAELEAINLQLKKAESMGRMAGAIAHHYNNMLAAVIGNLEMASRSIKKNIPPAEEVGDALEAARRAAEMGRLMLAYLGQTITEHNLVNLCQLCHEWYINFKPRVPNNLTLDLNFPSNVLAINANKDEISQMLSSFVVNAIEAMQEQEGIIFLEVGTIFGGKIPAVLRFPVEFNPKSDSYCYIEIKDRGCGIAQSEIENIFDPFYSTKFTGRGLGLAVALGTIKAHDGCITVESKVGVGTTFKIYLPLSLEHFDLKDKNCIKTDKESAVKDIATILLVEDEPMVRKMAANLIMKLGMIVIEAKDGVEAVNLFSEHKDRIDCVLSDLTMPRMNGWETITALRKISPDVKIVLVSGYDKSQIMAGAYKYNEMPQVFLTKPYSMTDLKNALVDALGH